MQKITALTAALLLVILLAMPAAAQTVKRTSFLVDNLSCGSCLTTIDGEVRKLAGALGMDADLQGRRVTIDHSPTLNGETIAAAITAIGYPARIDWSADLPAQQSASFGGGYGAGCGSSCGIQPGAGPASAAFWAGGKNENTVSTTLQVARLTCISCLSNISAELQQVPGTRGMAGDLGRGLVTVYHEPSLDGKQIAAVITRLGYPATITAGETLAVQASGDSRPPDSFATRGCGSRCSTATSWKSLYNKLKQ